MNPVELDKRLRNAFGTSEEWDADGIQIDLGNDIKKAVVSLDLTSDVIDFAIKTKADVVINHHPLFFNGVKNLSVSDSVGKRALSCVKNNISVLAYHTCLDMTSGGVNDSLCDILGIKNLVPFLPFGRLGSIENELDLDSFVKLCEERLNTRVQNTVNCGKTVKNIAVISGSGKDYIDDVLKTGADTFLTGEVNHAAMIDCKEYGLNLVCATHFATENVVLPFLKKQLCLYVPEVEIYGL
jgi:dinuclear metal center YbgI/SA1388 family protein